MVTKALLTRGMTMPALHRSTDAARLLRALLPAAALFCAGAGPLRAGPPSRLRLTVPAAPVAPGQEARVKIELLGEDRKPVPTLRERKIQLTGAGGLSPVATVTVPAGSSEVEVPIATSKPGLWQLEVTSPGLSSAAGVVLSLAHPADHPRPASQPLLRATARRPQPASPPPATTRAAPSPPAARPTLEARRNPGSMILRLPSPSAGAMRERAARVTAPAPASPAAAPAPEPAPPPPPPPAPAPVADRGHVELIAQPIKLRRGQRGWETSRVQAYWFRDEAPERTPHDIQLSLVLTGGSGNAGIDPPLLSIPRDAFMSPAAAQISAQGADTAQVKALYDGGVSKPVEISFLPTVPFQLGFEGPAEVVRGLATVSSDLYVRLLGEDGQPVPAAQPVPVTVAVEGPAGTVSQAVSIPVGAIEVRVPVDLARQGLYTVRASAPGLTPADPFTLTYAIDWLLIAFALAGGVLGSLARVLYRRERDRGPLRVLILGLLAAVLTLLLFSFGLLSILEGALPEGLAKLPSHGPFAALLLGFLAGLSFDKVFGRFLSGSEPAAAPAPAHGRKGRRGGGA
jgi:hypothetical protein